MLSALLHKFLHITNKLYKNIYRKQYYYVRRFVLVLHRKRFLKTNVFFLSLPGDYSLVMLKSINKLLYYFYNFTYCAILAFNLKAVLCYSGIQNIITVSFKQQQRFFKLACSCVFKAVRCLFVIFVRKLRLQGRMYRIYTLDIQDVGGWVKDLNNLYTGRLSLLFRVGLTHMLVIYLYTMRVHFKRKRKFFFYGYNFSDLSNKAKEVYNVYPIGIYTHKGIRNKGKISLKRIGKAQRW